MAKTNTKLKPVPDELSPQRQGLLDALNKVEELKAELEANEAAQTEARQKIRAAEETIKETAERVGVAHPDERRGLRKALEEAKEDLQDWRDHLDRLQREGGNFPPHVNKQGSLTFQLDLAKGDIAFARAALLKQHPIVLAMFAKLHALRAELFEVTADLLAIQAASGVPESEKNWQAINQERPAPDAALVAWIEALASDPAAELAE